MWTVFRPASGEPQGSRDRTGDAPPQLLHRHCPEEEQGGAHQVGFVFFQKLKLPLGHGIMDSVATCYAGGPESHASNIYVLAHNFCTDQASAKRCIVLKSWNMEDFGTVLRFCVAIRIQK